MNNEIDTYINFSDGGVFYFKDMHRSFISLGEIAAALSKICRFNGSCSEFYSVAQHSVMVSLLVPPQYAWDALMHDAVEAVLGDITSPLKAQLPDYQALERKVEGHLMNMYGFTKHDAVKLADLRALAAEKRDLMPDSIGEWSILKDIKAPRAKITPMDSRGAEQYFLNRCAALNYGHRKPAPPPWSKPEAPKAPPAAGGPPGWSA